MNNNIWVLVKVNSVWRIVFSLKSRGTGLVINLGFGVYRKVPFPAMISLECQIHVLHSKDSPSALLNLYSVLHLLLPRAGQLSLKKVGVSD